MKKNKKVAIVLICVALFLMLIEFSKSVSLFISNINVITNTDGDFEWFLSLFKNFDTIPWWSFRYIIEFFVIIILTHTLFYVCEFREKFNQKSKNEKIQKKIEKLQSQLDD